MDTSVSLKITDYFVLAFILLVSVGIGILYAVKDFRKANRTEYLLGGRRMFTLPVALSIFATFTDIAVNISIFQLIVDFLARLRSVVCHCFLSGRLTYLSGISIIGVPMDFYLHGSMANLVFISSSIACIYMILLIVPLVYPLPLMSLYEYLQCRYDSRAVRLLAVVAAMLQTMSYMSIALLSPGLVLQAGVGIPMWLSVGVVGLIGTLYTAIGGIKSVVWTDVFQCLVMLGGMFTIIIKGYSVVGGGNAVLNIIKESGRASFTDFSFDPRVKFTWWGITIGFGIHCFAGTCNQAAWQRISAMPSMRAAKNVFLINSVLFIVYSAMLTAMSWVIFAYYVHIRCDPFQAGILKNRNQLPPYFVMHALSDVPAIGGIYMAMIFSGTLSTLSSGINSLAAITVEDILKRPLHNLQESTITLITKCLVILYGTLSIVLAFGANFLQGSLTQIVVAITGGLVGAVLGMFLLGALIPWANKYGAFSGGVIALIFNMWITVGSQMYGRKSTTLAPPPTDMCFQNISSHSYSNNITMFNSQTNQSTILRTHLEKQPSDDGFFLYDISHNWFSAISFTITLVVGTVISHCTRKHCVSVTDQKYLFSFIRKLWLSETNDTIHEMNREETKAKL